MWRFCDAQTTLKNAPPKIRPSLYLLALKSVLPEGEIGGDTILAVVEKSDASEIV